MAIEVGARAPTVPGVPEGRARALIFYKVTCEVTQEVAPLLARFGLAYPGAVVGVGQDPPADLERFAERYGWRFLQQPDLAPYDASNAYGIASAPTVIVVGDDDRVADVVESWDRPGMNRASATLARLVGSDPVTISTLDDGFPDFKPG